MVIKLIIISLILLAFIMLALGIKLWLDPGAEFPSHSCALETGETGDDGSCSACQLKDLVDCPENKNSTLEMVIMTDGKNTDVKPLTNIYFKSVRKIQKRYKYYQ